MKINERWVNALYLAGIFAGLVGIFLAYQGSFFSRHFLLIAGLWSISLAVMMLRRRPNRRHDRIMAVSMLVYGILIGLLGANPWLWFVFAL